MRGRFIAGRVLSTRGAAAGGLLLLFVLASLWLHSTQQKLQPSAGAHATAIFDPFDPQVRALGDGLRDRNRQRITKRLREIGVKEPSEAQPWSFRHEIYLWEWYIPYWPCLDLERVGRSGDGGKWICGMGRLEALPPGECTVYSYGVRTEVSFEVELARRTRCHIRAFDPSVSKLPALASGVASITFESYGLSNVTDPKSRMETLETAMRRHGDTCVCGADPAALASPRAPRPWSMAC
jgi:hypothetical protein